MSFELIGQLKSGLADSRAKDRKYWARRIIDERIPLSNLLSLLHSEDKTAQRFMWLIGDVCELKPDVVATCMPVLFSLRNEMPFPGMPRSVAKWLGLTRVPCEIEQVAIEQLFEWLGSKAASIACKSYSAKALLDLANDKRVPAGKLKGVLERQANHENRAYGRRIKKLLDQLRS